MFVVMSKGQRIGEEYETVKPAVEVAQKHVMRDMTVEFEEVLIVEMGTDQVIRLRYEGPKNEE